MNIRFVTIIILFACSFANAQQLYTVDVINGWGGGKYRAGDTVHVFSRALDARDVFNRWESTPEVVFMPPDEWHTTFIMPNNNVSVRAHLDTLPLYELKEEQISGVERPKRVYHALPPSPCGVVFLYHGTGGSARGWLPGSVENFTFVKDLIAANFGVIITESEETTAQKDMNGDGFIRWDVAPPLPDASIDYRNLRAILDTLINRGTITTSVPLFGVGMSNGGAFAIPSAIALGMKAAVSYCASGRASNASIINIPCLWMMAANDDNENVGTTGNQEAVELARRLRERGVKADAVIRRAHPIYPEIFTRAGASESASRAIVSNLRDKGHLDERGYMRTTSNTIAAAVMADPASYPAIVTQKELTSNAIVNTLAVAYAEHNFFSDLSKQTITWLLGVLDGTTSVEQDVTRDPIISKDVYDLQGRHIQRLPDYETTDALSALSAYANVPLYVVTHYASGRVSTVGVLGR
ncbi:MAG: hypothetical protein ACK5BQ_08930 [Ignavibacteria bacterium]|jgi:poly(3-hydroxybutyrate) depolymerase